MARGRNLGGWLLSLFLLSACSGTHEREDDTGTPTPDAGPASDAFVPLADAGTDAPPVDAPEPIVGELLATCLTEGRGLTEVLVVDNNDTADHGALLRLGLSPGGNIAAAGADGTLKLWTLDAELLGTFNGAILTYGPEIPAAPITDIAFDAERILVGDVRGIVLQLVPEGGLEPVGGTTPEIGIRAVAFDPERRRLAHAQLGDVLPLTIRSEDGTTLELDSTITISELAFEADGSLLVAGSRGGHPVIERRSAPAFDVATDVSVTDVPGAFLELALAEGAPLGAVAPDHVLLAGMLFAHAGGRSIALATDANGAVALVAGTAGLSVFDAESPAGSLFDGALGDAVTVRVDASGTLAVVGTSDALIHVLACEP